MTRKLIEQLLEALSVATTPIAKDRQEVLAAITAAREYLAQPEQSEPDWKKPLEYVPPLVEWAQEQTAPPQVQPLRELSKLEIDTIAQQVGITAYEAPEWLQDFAKAILAAARSKT